MCFGKTHLRYRPHESTIDPHQLLVVDLDRFLSENLSFDFSNLVGLVQDNSDFVLIAMDGFDGSSELVRDIQLVGIKEENNPEVDSFIF